MILSSSSDISRWTKTSCRMRCGSRLLPGRHRPYSRAEAGGGVSPKITEVDTFSVEASPDSPVFCRSLHLPLNGQLRVCHVVVLLAVLGDRGEEGLQVPELGL